MGSNSGFLDPTCDDDASGSVVGVGLVAAFVGPEISKWTHDVAGLWLGNDTFSKAIELICGPGVAAVTLAAPGPNPPYQFAGTFIVLAFILVLLILIVSQVEFLPMGEREFGNSGRPRGEVICQPEFLVSVLCAVIGWSVMVMMMSATPLAVV